MTMHDNARCCSTFLITNVLVMRMTELSWAMAWHINIYGSDRIQFVSFLMVILRGSCTTYYLCVFGWMLLIPCILCLPALILNDSIGKMTLDWYPANTQ